MLNSLNIGKLCLQSRCSTSICAQLYGALLGPLYLPGLDAPSAAIAICQLLSETVPVVSCFFVYCVPDVVSPLHLTKNKGFVLEFKL